MEHDTKVSVEIAEIKKDIGSVVSTLEEIKDDISGMKESLYNPNDGLFARIVKLNQEGSKYTVILDLLGKVFWILLGGGVTLATKLLVG